MIHFTERPQSFVFAGRMTTTILDEPPVRTTADDPNRTSAGWPLATVWGVAFAMGLIPPAVERRSAEAKRAKRAA